MALCPDLLAVSDCTVHIGNRLLTYDWTLGLSLTRFMLQRQSIQMAEESQDMDDYEVRFRTAAFARAFKFTVSVLFAYDPSLLKPKSPPMPNLPMNAV